jgi:hypothetical protein
MILFHHRHEIAWQSDVIDSNRIESVAQGVLAA